MKKLNFLILWLVLWLVLWFFLNWIYTDYKLFQYQSKFERNTYIESSDDFSVYFDNLNKLKSKIIDQKKSIPYNKLFSEWDWWNKEQWFNWLISNVKLNKLNDNFIEKLKISSLWIETSEWENDISFEKIYDSLNILSKKYKNIYLIFDKSSEIFNNVEEKYMFDNYSYLLIWEVNEKDKYVSELTLTTENNIRYFKIWILNLDSKVVWVKWLIHKLLWNTNWKNSNHNFLEINEQLKSKILELDNYNQN